MASQTLDLAHFGHRRDTPDDRDLTYAPPAQAQIPASVDLREHFGTVYDQSPYKSCSAHAIASALTLLANKAGSPIPLPSRMFIYYNERERANERPITDSGSTLRNGIKAVASQGVCAENDWPYAAEYVNTQPPQDVYAKATIHALQYLRIDQNIDHMKACLVEGFPFVLGMQAYHSMQSVHSGVDQLPMPSGSDYALGLHAVMCAGYDDAKQSLLCVNSYGTVFGNNGWFYMPYAYAKDPNLSFDFWTIRKID